MEPYSPSLLTLIIKPQPRSPFWGRRWGSPWNGPRSGVFYRPPSFLYKFALCHYHGSVFISFVFNSLSFKNIHKNKQHTTVNEPQKSPANEFTQTDVLISATRSTYRPEIISSEGMWSWCSIRLPPVNPIPHIHYFSLMRIRNTELRTKRWFIRYWWL